MTAQEKTLLPLWSNTYIYVLNYFYVASHNIINEISNAKRESQPRPDSMVGIAGIIAVFGSLYGFFSPFYTFKYAAELG